MERALSSLTIQARGLLSASNRRLVDTIGNELATVEEHGGVVLYGCRMSGRGAIVDAVTARMALGGKAGDRSIKLNIRAQSDDEAEFLGVLLLELADWAEEAGEADLAQRIRDIFRPDCARKAAVPGLRGALRKALMGLKSTPLFVFTNVDYVIHTKRGLDNCFSALRSIFEEGGARALITSMEYPLPLDSGTSHFANNFVPYAPAPVSADDIAREWPRELPINSSTAAELVLGHWGRGEQRVKAGLASLKARLRNWAVPILADEDLDPGLVQALEDEAAAHLKPEANLVWGRVDKSFQSALVASMRRDWTSEAVLERVMRHDWAYMFLDREPEGAIRILDAALRRKVEAEILEEAIRKAPSETDELLDQIRGMISDGDPAVAWKLSEQLATQTSIPVKHVEAAGRLRALARAVDRVVQGDPDGAADALGSLGDGEGSPSHGAVETWRRWSRALKVEPPEKRWERAPPDVLVGVFSAEIGRGDRRQTLGRVMDAFRDYCNVVDAALAAVLIRGGWKQGSGIASSSERWLERYQQAVRETRPPCELPTVLPCQFHGSIEAYQLCRALGFGGVEVIRPKDLREVMTRRNDVNHAPTVIGPEHARQAGNLARQVLTGVASFWGQAPPAWGWYAVVPEELLKPSWWVGGRGNGGG